jgi:hypothetical protein
MGTNARKISRRFGAFLRLAALLILLLSTPLAHAAQLTLGAPRIGANGWEAPLTLMPGSGENVASMQFDLLVPPGITNAASAQASQAAALAGKQAIYSVVGPGQVRVVIAGLNQSALQGGEVATLYLGPAAEGQAAPSAWLASPVLASPAGERVPVETDNPTTEGEEDDEGEVAEDPDDDPDTTPEGEADPIDDDDPKSTEGEATDDEGSGGGGSLNPYYPGGMGGGGGDFSNDGTAKAKAKKKASAARTKTAANTAAAAKGAKPGGNLNPQAAPYRDPGAPSKGKPAAPPGGQFGPIPFGKGGTASDSATEATLPTEVAASEDFPTQLAQNNSPSGLSSLPGVVYPHALPSAPGGAVSSTLSTNGSGYWYLMIPLIALIAVVFVVLRGSEHILVTTLKRLKKKRPRQKHH